MYLPVSEAWRTGLQRCTSRLHRLSFWPIKWWAFASTLLGVNASSEQSRREWLGGRIEGDFQRDLLRVLLCQRGGPCREPRSVTHHLIWQNEVQTSWAEDSFFRLCLPPGTELDWSSDVRRRIEESSYIQQQYVLTRCSLSSERSLQIHSQPHAASNSDPAGCGVFLPEAHSSGSVLDTGSLPQGLEKMSPPEQRSSLSRWADTALQQNLSVEMVDNLAEMVTKWPNVDLWFFR